MLHLFKYRFLQTVRDIPNMFWALVFPLILGTLFYVSFGSAGLASTGEAKWEAVKVAVILEDNSSENASAFKRFLEEMDGDTLDIQNISSESEAIRALQEESIRGIYYVKESPCLTVKQNGINESILTALLDNYNQNSAMIQKIALSYPENIPKALDSMGDYRQMIREESLGGATLNPNVQYFFALIAFACLSGVYLGVRSSFDTQANLSPLGARRSVTPTHRFTLVIVDMLVLFVIHFFNILILNLFIVKVLGISLGNDILSLLLVDLMGSMIGVCFGLALGCVSKLTMGVKIALSVSLTLIPAFLAGLMFGNMKNIIELHCPIINRINPAAVLSDAFYCMGVYSDANRLARSLIILAIMSVLLLCIAFLGIRRDRYDSI